MNTDSNEAEVPALDIYPVPTSVSTAAAHHRNCRSTASRSPVLTRGGVCVPPTVTYLPYRVSRSTLTAVGRSQLLARWPGTHSRILSVIQRAAQTVLQASAKSVLLCTESITASQRLCAVPMHALTPPPTPTCRPGMCCNIQSSLVSTNVTSALEVFLNDMRYINPRFTYFTYLLIRRCNQRLRYKRCGKWNA